MAAFHDQARLWLTALVTLAAVGFIVGWFMVRPRFDETQMRDTTGIQATVADGQWHRGRYTALLTVTNGAAVPASSVVLTVELMDVRGEVVGSNPLVNLLDLQPGETRAQRIMVPVFAADASMEGVVPRAQVTLARWQD